MRKAKWQSLLFAVVLGVIFCTPMALAADTVSAPGVYPISNPGDISVKIMVIGSPSIIDWETNAMSVWMEEQTGIKVEYQPIPQEGAKDALTLALSSGDYPDAFMIPLGGVMTQDLITQYGVNEGRFLVLDDFVDQMPNLQKVFEENPGYRGLMTQLDGHMYAFPNINQCYHCTMYKRTWINTEFLKAVGKEMPTTLDELYDVLVAFRDGDPNGNGEKDEIPLAGALMSGWGTQPEHLIMNAFNFYNCNIQANASGRTPLGLYLENDKATAPFDKEGFREGLKFMRKLYDEGLLYDGVFTTDDQTIVNLIEYPDAERVGVVAGGYGACFSDMAGERYPHYEILMPVTGPTGLKQLPQDNYDLGPSGFVISKDSPHALALAKWADLMYSFEGTMRGYYGSEGTAWRLAEAGETGLDAQPALYKPLIPWQEVEPQNDHTVQLSIGYRNAAFRNGEVYDNATSLFSGEGLEALLYRATASLQEYANTSVFPPVKFTKEDTEAMAVSLVEVDKVILEYVPGFMNGTFDPNGADYDTFLTKLKDAGIDMLLEKYQAAYDAQFKK